MIDLHLHTTASDGDHAPSELVALACAAGLRLISITDHDTVAGLEEAACAASALGLGFVNGIEISTVLDGRDVHLLGYAFDPADRALTDFLRDQRDDRVRRVGEMGDRLAALGAPIDVRPIVALARAGGEQSVGRPQIARALVEAGHVASALEAFERFLYEGGPAYVPRCSATPHEVVGLIRRAGGLASLAHPVHTKRDDAIPGLVEAGLFAIEAWHADHDAQVTAHYVSLAARLDLALSGGSDFHGSARDRRLGSVVLPEAVWGEFVARAAGAGVVNLPAIPARLYTRDG